MQQRSSLRATGSGKDISYRTRIPTTSLRLIREKIIQNLAALNYDTNNLELAAYDWRLSYVNLEIRDNYFSRLKSGIEGHK